MSDVARGAVQNVIKTSESFCEKVVSVGYFPLVFRIVSQAAAGQRPSVMLDCSGFRKKPCAFGRAAPSRGKLCWPTAGSGWLRLSVIAEVSKRDHSGWCVGGTGSLSMHNCEKGENTQKI